MPLARSRSCSTRTISSRQIGVAARRQLRLRRHHRGVERGELGAKFLLGVVQRDLLAGERGKPRTQRSDLAARAGRSAARSAR